MDKLKDKAKALAIKAQTVVSDAEMTMADKKEALDKIEADLKDVQTKIADEDYLTEQRKRFAVDAGDEPPKERAEVRSIGTQFVESDGYKSTVDGGLKGGRWTTGAVDIKATLTEATASGGPLVQVDDSATAPLPILFRRLMVAQLIPSGSTNSNAVRYPIELAATNAAAAVLEGGAKPESTLTFDTVDDVVKKIATTLPVTDEMLEDFAQIRSYIDTRLRLFVSLTEEAQILQGDGLGANLTGIRNRAGLQTDVAVGVSPDNGPDAIHRMITQIRTGAFLEPDGMVIHPNDWQQLKLAKDGNGQYYGGGPFTGPYGNGGVDMSEQIWGLRAVVTPLITEGTALVGCFGTCAQLFRKGGITVEASNSHASFFTENKTMLRAEERLALAVYRPAGFGEVTGL